MRAGGRVSGGIAAAAGGLITAQEVSVAGLLLVPFELAALTALVVVTEVKVVDRAAPRRRPRPARRAPAAHRGGDRVVDVGPGRTPDRAVGDGAGRPARPRRPPAARASTCGPGSRATYGPRPAPHRRGGRRLAQPQGHARHRHPGRPRPRPAPLTDPRVGISRRKSVDGHDAYARGACPSSRRRCAGRSRPSPTPTPTASSAWAPTSSPARCWPPTAGHVPHAARRPRADRLVVARPAGGDPARRAAGQPVAAAQPAAATRSGSTPPSTTWSTPAPTRPGRTAGSRPRSAAPTARCTSSGGPTRSRPGRATTASWSGGLYGVAIGGLFAGESMFHRRTDASKVALVGLVGLLRERRRRRPAARRAVA